MHCQLPCIAKHVLYSSLRTLKYRTFAYARILHKNNTDVTDPQSFMPASAWHSCRDAALFPNYFGQTCSLTGSRMHTNFRSVAKSVTLSDLERPCCRHYALFHTIRQLSEQTASNSLKLDPCCEHQECSPKSVVFWQYAIWFMEDDARYLCDN